MIGSPYIHTGNASVTRTMGLVLLALIPGIVAHLWLFGPGIFVSLLICSVFAILFESLMLLLRGLPPGPFLKDGSALVTAWLLALTMPTLLPWWLYALGILCAIVLAKHLYGGLGQNPFNPAMVGYAILLVSFPAQLTTWAAPTDLALHAPGLAEAFDIVFAAGGSITPDAYSAATPLDSFKIYLRASRPLDAGLAAFVPTLQARDMVALAFMAGGLGLLALRVMTWHIPVAFLLGIFATSGLIYGLDPAHQISPLHHLLFGGSLLGAFFIATDPISAATTPMGKLIYAGLAGILVVLIRVFGNFPDGIVFAILLMNACAPLIDTYTQPRVFGQERHPRT